MRACVLRGENRHRALTRACALRYISVASGNRCLESGSRSGSAGFDFTAIGTVGALYSPVPIGCEATFITSGTVALMRYAV